MEVVKNVSVVHNNKYYVYSHSDKNGVFYIGMGKLGRAFELSSRNQKWDDYFKAMNEPVSIEILEVFDHKSDAFKREKELIFELQPVCNIQSKIKQKTPKKRRLPVAIVNERVVSLRNQGYTFTEIGKMLGITRQRAHQIYKKLTT